MTLINFMEELHKSTQRDYLSRVNDPEYPKHKAAELAKKFSYDYWDGDRRICYGGYKYIPGRWTNLAKKLISYYKLTNTSSILDIGSGKGFLLYELSLLLPGCSIKGIDISTYAIENSKAEIKANQILGCASELPFEDNSFDLIISINTLHCLNVIKLERALKEIERVGKEKKYICVESYRNEIEKTNLLYWQVTCESFYDVNGWEWWFHKTGYRGDFSFIFFE